MTRFQSLRATSGVTFACEQLGLIRRDESPSLQTPTTDTNLELTAFANLTLNWTPAFPSLSLCSRLADYFLHPKLSFPVPLINSTVFEALITQEPTILHAVAFECLCVFMPPSPQLVDEFPELAKLTSEEIKSYSDALQVKLKKYLESNTPSFTYIVTFAMYCMGYVHRGLMDDIEWMCRRLQHCCKILLADQTLGVTYHSSMPFGSSFWLRSEVIRRSIWHATSALENPARAAGKVWVPLPWHLQSRIALFCPEAVFDAAKITQTKSSVETMGWHLSEEEWMRVYTLDWMALPRGPERNAALHHHITRMADSSPWNLFIIGCIVANRASRGSIELGWKGTIMTDSEDIGTLKAHHVTMEEFLAPGHWIDLIHDIRLHLPEEIRDADADGRGDELLNIAEKMWGTTFIVRLLVPINMLHEASIGCILRSLPRRYTPATYVADLIIAETDDENLQMAMFNEAMMISRNMGGVLQAHPNLTNLALSYFPQTLRIGIFHIALARRMQALGVSNTELVNSSEDDARVTLSFLSTLTRRYPWLKKQREIFEKLVNKQGEPLVTDLDGIYGNSFGFLTRYTNV